jgi:hypothetical protein
MIGECTVLDEVWIEVGELGDVEDFDIEVWVFEFEAGSEETGVGGGFLKRAGNGDDFVDHKMNKLQYKSEGVI